MFASRILMIVAVLASWFPDTSPATAGMTELKAVQGGHFVAIADINGTPVRVMVDTGATTVALSYEDAEAAGLKPARLDFNAPVATANGTVGAARVTIRRVEIDGVRVNDVPAMVLPQGAMRGSLLGMSFLSRLRSFSVEDGVLRLRD
ncbi:TIGR02281 family clan AA aspartic protease [Aestuariivirga sp.]|jgi:aspartyl protease family protein|uniref:TIGR02281 family clan AA aspartic protease n=1 Tax=Aestuariivirga sp. TaxID=2650926 RepID=UPI003784FA4C